MCKKSRCVGIQHKGGCLDARNYLKYFKRGWNRKEGGRGDEDLRKGAKLGHRVNVLKKRSWNPLTNMMLL